jgi:hypothetical protein
MKRGSRPFLLIKIKTEVKEVGPLVTTAWRFLGLQMEGKASSIGG